MQRQVFESRALISKDSRIAVVAVEIMSWDNILKIRNCGTEPEKSLLHDVCHTRNRSSLIRMMTIIS